MIKVRWSIWLFCLIPLLISCQSRNGVEEITSNSNESSQTPPEVLPLDEEPREVKTLELDTNDLVKVIGWVNEEEILYVSNVKGTHQIIRYHLYTEEESLIYKTEHPFVEALISKSKQQLMVHTAPITYSAHLVIIDMKGNVLQEKDIPSYELMSKWNDFEEGLLFITKFDEHWNHQTFLWNLSNNDLIVLEEAEPFLTWRNEDTWLYQRWSTSDIQLTAPLYESGFHKDEKLLNEEVYQFDVFEDFLMEIIVTEDDLDKARYDFFGRSSEKLSASFTVPHLDKYSNWLVPFYSQGEESFFTFVPYQSGLMDAYQDQYQLVQWDASKGKENVLFDKVENEPLLCNSIGSLCLYGYQGEKLIDVEKSEIIQLVEEKGEVTE
ncbi:hypothetical protein [Bacillus sp. 2205SS5-2]|uniref:YqgU-like beta propeller domain-containing protein n=1 Tax=Bacillus sp. 2205SS5-2 TaxID=3109031 RepID=UPI00300496F8